MQNYKTTLFGILTILLTAAGPVLDHYYPLGGLNWTSLCATLAGVSGGAGLLAAKDSTTHSTDAQVAKATVAEAIKEQPKP